MLVYQRVKRLMKGKLMFEPLMVPESGFIDPFPSKMWGKVQAWVNKLTNCDVARH
jgi:hypothetical protein